MDRRLETELSLFLWVVVVVVVDVGNGVDKWIVMLFPTQTLTHGQTSPLAEREKEAEKDEKKDGQKGSTNKHNRLSSPSVNFTRLLQ